MSIMKISNLFVYQEASQLNSGSQFELQHLLLDCFHTHTVTVAITRLSFILKIILVFFGLKDIIFAYLPLKKWSCGQKPLQNLMSSICLRLAKTSTLASSGKCLKKLSAQIQQQVQLPAVPGQCCKCQGCSGSLCLSQVEPI